jgi:hypothetical protein
LKAEPVSQSSARLPMRRSNWTFRGKRLQTIRKGHLRHRRVVASVGSTLKIKKQKRKSWFAQSRFNDRQTTMKMNFFNKKCIVNFN